MQINIRCSVLMIFENRVRFVIQRTKYGIGKIYDLFSILLPLPRTSFNHYT